MKKLRFLLVALLFAVSLQAQTIDTTLTLTTTITTVKIQPITVSMYDTVRATGLGVKIVSDNLMNDCTLYYQLVDSLGRALHRGNIDVTGTDYSSWTGDNVYPFTYVSNKLKLTLK